MPLRRTVATLAAGVAVLGPLTLSGCDEDAPAATPASDASTSAPVDDSAYPTYVALGDSYTAAPGVPQTDLTTGCARSDGNYPRLVAAALGSELVDVSCSGASTLSLVGAQQTNGGAVPPQFGALSEDTSLVTVGIGGNDERLFQTMVGTCARLASGAADDGSPCREQLGPSDQHGDLLLEKVETIRGRVTAALTGVHDRAPSATVVLVGYPQPVPPRGTCPTLPLAAGDYAYVRSSVEALNGALRAAADEADATFVDVAAASAGHDICAGADAWVNGSQTDLSRAVAFHPFAAEQRAVADLVVAGLAS
jgi:lysophospholipase L1-like esterase